MEQTDLRTHLTAARLAFVDHVDYLVAGQRAPGSPKRTEALAGVNPPLDGPVVLLQDIIEVRHRPVLAAGVQRSFTLELSDRGRVSRMPIGVDNGARDGSAVPRLWPGGNIPDFGAILWMSELWLG